MKAGIRAKSWLRAALRLVCGGAFALLVVGCGDTLPRLAPNAFCPGTLEACAEAGPWRDPPPSVANEYALYTLRFDVPAMTTAATTAYEGPARDTIFVRGGEGSLRLGVHSASMPHGLRVTPAVVRSPQELRLRAGDDARKVYVENVRVLSPNIPLP